MRAKGKSKVSGFARGCLIVSSILIMVLILEIRFWVLRKRAHTPYRVNLRVCAENSGVSGRFEEHKCLYTQVQKTMRI